MSHRRVVLAVAAAASLTASVAVASPASAASHRPSPASAVAAGSQSAVEVLAEVHTAGRVKDNGDTVQYTWPGVYFEGQFRGTGVGVSLNDSVNDYEVQVDGTTVATLVTPGLLTHWVENLADAVHSVRLVKRTESPWGPGTFGGFIAAPGGEILAKPAARSRQIEFIGDSFTAGYGNLSTTRDCSATGGIDRNSNADISFGALTAKSLNADYQINAWSGRGIVRNYGGQSPGENFQTYYDRTLQAASEEVWQNPGTWRPQLVVIGLGINDFSTALNAGEQWTSNDSLIADYKASYLAFLEKLRAQYGPDTAIVVSATLLSNTTAFADAAQQVVEQRNSQGDAQVHYWYYDDPALDHLGCDWHPSAHDHVIISGLLNNLIATLPLNW